MCSKEKIAKEMVQLFMIQANLLEAYKIMTENYYPGKIEDIEVLGKLCKEIENKLNNTKSIYHKHC